MLMKTILLSLSFCLTSLLICNEAEERPSEELKIDPFIAMKEQFAKARKRGWDFSVEKKKAEVRKENKGLQFSFGPVPPNSSSMQKTVAQSNSYRKDISEIERGKIFNHLSEMDSNSKYPK